MTAPAVEARTTPAPIRVPAVASTAIQDLLSRSDETATVLGASRRVVWLLVDDDVIVVSTRDATRLPNGIEIVMDAAAGPFRMVHHGASVVIGSGQVMFEGLTVDIVRWWDPRPALRRISATDLARATAGLPSTLPEVESGVLAEALSAGSPRNILAAAHSLIGRGPGLTPEGDDYLAGALAAYRMLGEALGGTQTTATLDSVAGPLARLASIRTTSFSAALIRHAVDGRVAAPVGSLLHALTGRGDIALSHRDLTHVGHTSGPALAAGIVLGASSLLQALPTSQRR